MSGFRRGALQWRSPQNPPVGTPATYELNSGSRRESGTVTTGSLQVGPVVVKTDHVVDKRTAGKRAKVASQLPATPWDKDDRAASPATSDPFQDPFQDRAAREAKRGRRPALQVKFKLGEPQAAAAGYQRLEDLLLPEETKEEGEEETPEAATAQTPSATADELPADESAAPSDEFSPTFPAPSQDFDAGLPQTDESDLAPPEQSLPEVDEISPFQTEEGAQEDVNPPLDLTQPQPQDDAIRLPDGTGDADRPDGSQDDALQPPPLPGGDALPREPSQNDQLPELRFKDEFNGPQGPPKGEDGYRSDETEEADEEDDEDQVPCDRQYNGRNCCEEDATCMRIIKAEAGREIQNISLDIAPPFEIDERGRPTDKHKQQKLATIPSKTWMSSDNRVLATGYLSDLRGKHLFVRGEDGTEQPIPLEDLSRDDLCFLTAHWQLPAECPLPGDTHALRDFTMITCTWTASALCHKPLYFQDVSLERYGHSSGPLRQPLLSAAHFFGSVVLLPYSMRLYPPTECKYALGYYEPGDCAPWLIPAFPLSKRAALAELSFALGLWGFIN